MPHFSDLSKSRLIGCDEPLQVVCNEVILYFDVSVIWGQRGQEAQDEAYGNGYSQKKWPYSLHNRIQSLAVDLVPYPIDYNDIERFCLMSGYVLCIAAQKNVSLRWGGTWGDYGHFEIR